MGLQRALPGTSGLELIKSMSGSATGFAIADIPATFRDLYMTITGEAANPTDVNLIFNNDGTSIYDWQRSSQYAGNAHSNTVAAASGAISIGSIGGGSPQGGSIVVEIPGYALSFRKLAHGRSIRWDNDGVMGYTQICNGRWRSGAVINRLDVYCGQTLNVAINLYGIR